MQSTPKIGLLPLYLSLYDQTSPERRRGFDPMMATIVQSLEDAGIQVVQSGICCVRSEFEAAVRLFEREEVALIVTLHLAYSPSLESADALVATKIPILMLDTTMDYSFGPDVDRERIFYDHGIHGVQDLASVLRRRSRDFKVVAGHVTESDVLERTKTIALAAHAARRLRNTRALRIGAPFGGMGDFAVEDEVMAEALGITVDQVTTEALVARMADVSDAAIEEERARDLARFDVEADEATHRRSLRVGLALRRLLDEGGYAAFSMNFLAFESGKAGSVDTVPFLEASKAMARGIGYAGEGDVLTAALVGALSATYGKTSFTEIFCPDWHGDSLFLSHMGEINPDIAAAKPRLVELDFPYTSALNPLIPACGFGPGPATLVNLAPGPSEGFGLVVAEVDMLADTANPAMHQSIRGWMRPHGRFFTNSIATFLERYSLCGGTHHSALVYGHRTKEMEHFAEFAGLAGANTVS